MAWHFPTVICLFLSKLSTDPFNFFYISKEAQDVKNYTGQIKKCKVLGLAPFSSQNGYVILKKVFLKTKIKVQG